MSKSSDKDSAFGLSGEQIERLLSIGYGKNPDVVEPLSSSGACDREHTPSELEEIESTPRIDGYEVIEKVAEAGQGQVWRALQHSTGRVVAIKVPRIGKVTSERARVRFEREIELAARLKHPNITRIYDSGVDRGQYYYVMDFVEGLNLDEYVRQHDLSNRQILELMRTICQAVQHAHQNGIIHRDLKPSNIIVTDSGRPFIIDFGLAKGFSEDDGNLVVSVDGETFGTPAYMSPEQAAGHTDKVDTRTDVYSLGVTLFTLLTGSNPHDMSGTRLEVMHRIAEQEVIRPRTINRKIDKDIESLLLKALERDPDRRYSSAAGLAEDIDNYLKGEPLIAGPPTSLYRVKKFIRRHAVLSAAIIAVAFTLILGLTGIGIMYFRAEEALVEATAISDFLVNDILGYENLPEIQELSPDYILNNATEKLEGKFEDQPLVEAKIRSMLGQRYLKINKPELAKGHLEKAYQIYLQHHGPEYPDTIKTVNLICWVDFHEGRHDKAIQRWTEQIKITRREYGELHGLGMMFMMNIGNTYVYLGKHKEAEEWLDKTLELCGRSKSTRMPYVRRMARIQQGLNYTAQGRYDEAEQIYLKVLQEERQGAKDWRTLGTAIILSKVYRLQGQYEKAQQLCETTLDTMRQELGEAHSETLRAKCCLGQILTDRHLYPEAEKLIKEALEGQQHKFGNDHVETLASINSLAVLYKEQARYAEAEQLLFKAVEGRRLKLGDTHPHTLESWSNLIELYEAWNKPEKANQWRAKSIGKS
jgi:serine/threonine protein kinase